MPDLQKPIRQMEQRLGQLSREVLRIESHIRRGETRAASARIKGVRDQLRSLRGASDTAVQLAMVGAQLGFLSGSGSVLRGRLPAALLCGLGGWMYGQSTVLDQQREVEEVAAHLASLEEQLTTSDSPGAQENSGTTSDPASAG